MLYDEQQLSFEAIFQYFTTSYLLVKHDCKLSQQ